MPLPLAELQRHVARGGSIHPEDWNNAVRLGLVGPRLNVDRDMGGSFRQHYPSVATMNRRYFQPVSGLGEDPPQTPEDEHLQACGTKVYSGLSQIVYLAAFVILVPYAFEKGRAHARGR